LRLQRSGIWFGLLLVDEPRRLHPARLAGASAVPVLVPLFVLMLGPLVGVCICRSSRVRNKGWRAEGYRSSMSNRNSMPREWDSAGLGSGHARRKILSRRTSGFVHFFRFRVAKTTPVGVQVWSSCSYQTSAIMMVLVKIRSNRRRTSSTPAQDKLPLRKPSRTQTSGERKKKRASFIPPREKWWIQKKKKKDEVFMYCRQATRRVKFLLNVDQVILMKLRYRDTVTLR